MERSNARGFEFKDIQQKVKGKKLMIGAGIDNRPGWVTLDIVPCEGIDVVHDLDVFPYPFETSEISYIFAKHVVEHLTDIVKVMEECHRILKPNGFFEIIVPYYKHRNAYTDPTHKHFFTKYTMDYFIDKGGRTKIDWYSNVRFKKIIQKKYNNGFPFWHIRQRTGIWIETPFFADTMHWLLQVIK